MEIFLISHNDIVLVQPSLEVGLEGGRSTWVGDRSSFVVHATQSKLGFSLHGDTVLKKEINPYILFFVKFSA